jgi:hypothetical protein
MSTVKFKDGTSLALENLNGNDVYFQGAKRDSLEFQFSTSSTTYDVLKALTADSTNTEEITVTADDGITCNTYDNYVIRVSLGIKSVVVTPATGTTAEADEDRLCVTLAQLTYAEVLAAQAAAQIAALGAQVAALTLGGAVS